MLRIQRHGRVQEWVAEELGIFKKLGLDYEVTGHRSQHGERSSAFPPIPQDPQGLPSAYCDFLHGCASTNVAATSLWAVAVAVSSGYGRLWPHAYGLMPAGIYVRPGVDIRKPQDLAGLEMIVGRHSGSHFSALNALQGNLTPEQINLKLVAGRLGRLKAVLAHEAPASSMYGLEAYILEQHGFTKVLDTTFMVAYMTVGDPDMGKVGKYFDAMRLSQCAVDEAPHRYRHYLLSEFPHEVKGMTDLNRCGIGERIEFGPCSKETYHRARDWAIQRGILPRDWIGSMEP